VLAGEHNAISCYKDCKIKMTMHCVQKTEFPCSNFMQAMQILSAMLKL
jgi:hypothetical protein